MDPKNQQQMGSGVSNLSNQLNTPLGNTGQVNVNPIDEGNKEDVPNNQVSTPTPTPTPTPKPISYANKEHAGTNLFSLGSERSIMEASEKEPQLHVEVKDVGVEVVEEPKIPQEAISYGVSYAKEATSLNPAPVVNLPFTQVQAKEQSKKGSISNAPRWLALAVFRQWQILNLKRKKSYDK